LNIKLAVPAAQASSESYEKIRANAKSKGAMEMSEMKTQWQKQKINSL